MKFTTPSPQMYRVHFTGTENDQKGGRGGASEYFSNATGVTFDQETQWFSTKVIQSAVLFSRAVSALLTRPSNPESRPEKSFSLDNSRNHRSLLNKNPQTRSHHVRLLIFLWSMIHRIQSPYYPTIDYSTVTSVPF